MKIAAAVVTYNRLYLLKDLVTVLRNQTRKLDSIIIINNSSTDGTLEWLKEQDDLIVITQENVGSSGGQNTAFKTAFNLNYDYTWIMDDDVLPELNCLEELIKYASSDRVVLPLRYNNDKSPYLNDTILLNLSNPFKSIWKQVMSNSDLNADKIKVEGPTFEGPFFPKAIFEKVGFPEKDFFIYGDDTEYFVRLKKIGFKSFIIPSAKMTRKIDPPKDMFEFTWKHYYVLRNLIAIDKLHSNALVKLFRPILYLLVWLRRSNDFNQIKTYIKAFYDGITFKSNT